MGPALESLNVDEVIAADAIAEVGPDPHDSGAAGYIAGQEAIDADGALATLDREGWSQDQASVGWRAGLAQGANDLASIEGQIFAAYGVEESP